MSVIVFILLYHVNYGMYYEAIVKIQTKKKKSPHEVEKKEEIHENV